VRHFRISIDIDAPPERVWQVMSEVERWHEWTPSVTSIKRLGDGPFAVGNRLVIRQPKFPPALWKVKEIERGKGFVSESFAPGLRVIARHFVEPAPTGSRATLSLELQGLFGGLFGRLTQGITERYIALEAAGLKARSENPAFHHS
jgi:hypothetical protein